MKEAESRLRLYKHYIPLIVSAISESIKIDTRMLSEAFAQLAEKHVRGEIAGANISEKQDKITGQRIEREAVNSDTKVENRPNPNPILEKTKPLVQHDKTHSSKGSAKSSAQKKVQTTMDVFYKKREKESK
jgi:DNA topoisomerase-6 subunit B